MSNQDPVEKKSDDELLQNAQRLVSPCDRCGACLPVCPLFGARDVESSSARGKNTLIRALAGGVIEPGPTSWPRSTSAFSAGPASKLSEPGGHRRGDGRYPPVPPEPDGAVNAKYRAVGGFLQSRGTGEAGGRARWLSCARRASTVFCPTAWRRTSIPRSFPGRLCRTGRTRDSRPPLPRRPSRRGRRSPIFKVAGCGCSFPAPPPRRSRSCLALPGRSSRTTPAAAFPTLPTVCETPSSPWPVRTSACMRIAIWS